ncbi:zinc finger protein 208 [Amyelois transitella]|uniref:zinc finger protein 208 n=1 Tax=Amyelois transitella TaxID=680683 RepID=UPI00298FA268|nr:zinc finger protein 208 [Amyelois transitella]
MEFDEIVVKESPGLCRCCLSEGCYKDMGTEYTWMNENEVYADMLLECFDIGISQHSDGPNGPNRLICEVCITRLRDACNFKKQVLESEKKFIDMIGRGEFAPKVLIYQSQLKAEAEDTTLNEPEYLDDDMDFDDDEPLKPPEEPSVSDITVSTLPVKNKRGRPKKTVVKTEKKAKVAKMEEKAKSSKTLVKDENAPARKEGLTSERRRKNLQILFNNTTIIPFKWRSNFVCFYCAKTYKDYIEFRKHTKFHGQCTTKDYSLKAVSGNHIEIKIDVSEINCSICDESCINLNEVIKHLISKHDMKYDTSVEIPYQAYKLVDLQCLYCDEKFSYFGYLIHHVNISHPKYNLVCVECGASFNKKNYLMLHVRSVHRKDGYSCDQCQMKFSTYHLLRSHRNTVHFLKCKNCDLHFDSRILLQRHILADHPDDVDVKCVFCGRICRNTDGLATHIRKCKVKLENLKLDNSPHLNNKTVILTPKKNNNLVKIRQNVQSVLNMSTAVPFCFFNRFSCFYCSKKFTEFDTLKEHTNSEHTICDSKSKSMMRFKGKNLTVKIDISSLSCKLCSLSMSGLEMLIDHLIAEHAVDYDKSLPCCLEPYKIYKEGVACPLCPEQIFSFFGSLLKHMNNSHNDNKIICIFCGLSFRTETNMRSHVSRLHKRDGYKCTICNLEFNSRDSLQSHSGNAHGTKISKCPECPEAFSSKNIMRRHLIDAHGTGQKCQHCGKLFPKKCLMLDHVRSTHLKEKNVQCNMCQQKFFNGRLLKKHLVKHFGERNFHCDICGKQFLWKKNLSKKHLFSDEYPPGPYDGCASERRRKNLRILFNNTTIIPFKWRGKFLCFYCAKSYSEYPEFRKHTKSHGPCTTKDYALKVIKGNHIEIKVDVSEITCDICNEPFGNMSEIVDHLVGKHNMEYDKSVDIPFQAYRLIDFKCLCCDQQFSYFGSLVSHVNIMHPQNSFICDDCGATFNKKRDLAVHMRNLHRQGGYPCDQCTENFDTYYSLRTHQNTAHFRKCKNCSLHFLSPALLQKHMKAEHPEDGNVKCSFCGKECHSTNGLAQHTARCKVKLIAQPDEPPPPVFDSFPSGVGSKPKKKQNILQIRQNIQCVLNMSTAIPFKFFSKFSCFYCSKKFTEYEELKEHTILEHPVCELKSKCMKKCKGERITVKIDIACLSCKICSQPMSELDVLIDHLIVEHKANYDKSFTRCFEPFKIIKDSLPCPVCPERVFRYFATLLKHLNAEHSNNNRICDFCGRCFRNVANLKVHISYAHTGCCECTICGAKYKNQWCLARHRAKVHNAKDYGCTKCPEKFPSAYHRQKHMIKAHDIGHKCTYCGRMFTRNSFMKDHIRRTHLREKNVPCSVCNERFFDNYLLRMHMVKHDGERKFTCDVCGKAFLRRSAKFSTLEDKHKKMESARKLLIKRRNVEYVLQYSNATPFLWYKSKYRCFFCSEPMKDPSILREHTATAHQFANIELAVHDRTKNNRNKDAAVKIDVTDLTCNLCTTSVDTLEELIHHLIIAHDAEYDLEVPNCLLPFKLDKDNLTCPTCNMKFVFFEYLLRHANKHHLSHDYICDVCGTSFQGENHLKMHHRYYHREGGYTCDYCGISLATLSKKILHEKNVHHVNLPTCPHCSETFLSPYFKKLHLANVHRVEEVIIKCPYCPKVYPQESIMSRHMRRVHLREKNVECEVCGDKFFGPYDVKMHMVKHNGEKKFICSVCGKKFSKKSNLNSHSVSHTGEKKFVCSICNKAFAHLTNYRIHMKNRHVEFTEETEGLVELQADSESVQLEFVGDDLEGAEVIGQYVH